MTTSNIESLLEKYWEGETTLDEERALKAYFAQAQIDEKWRDTAPFFRALRDEQALERTTGQTQTKAPLRPSFVRLPMQWAAAAALVGLMATAAWWTFQARQARQLLEQRAAIQTKLNSDTFEDPKQAAEEIKAVLALVSSKMNKGKRKALKSLQKMEKVERYLPKSPH